MFENPKCKSCFRLFIKQLQAFFQASSNSVAHLSSILRGRRPRQRTVRRQSINRSGLAGPGRAPLWDNASAERRGQLGPTTPLYAAAVAVAAHRCCSRRCRRCSRRCTAAATDANSAQQRQLTDTSAAAAAGRQTPQPTPLPVRLTS